MGLILAYNKIRTQLVYIRCDVCSTDLPTYLDPYEIQDIDRLLNYIGWLSFMDGTICYCPKCRNTKHE